MGGEWGVGGNGKNQKNNKYPSFLFIKTLQYSTSSSPLLYRQYKEICFAKRSEIGRNIVSSFSVLAYISVEGDDCSFALFMYILQDSL